MILICITGLATNRDDENSTADFKIKTSKAKEKDKRKLSSTLEEYELNTKDESEEKENNNQAKDIEDGTFFIPFSSIV